MKTGSGVGRVWLAVLLAGFGLAGLGSGYGVAQTSETAKAVDAGDAQVRVAEALVGKALFLRGFYLNNDLKYDAAGQVLGSPKVGDWTVAAVNVLKAERRGADEMELDGVRVAIRYNADSHEFQRHALNDEKMRLVVEDAGDARGLEAAFAAMFAVGIDPALQRAMPNYWRHYFDPGLGWPEDALSGQTVYATYGQPEAGQQVGAKDLTPPHVEHRADAKYPGFAQRDRVQGALLVRMVVDAEGVPRRICVARPLGYGLDESAVEAMAKWRFAPGMRDGKPVAAGVVVQQEFSVMAPPLR